MIENVKLDGLNEQKYTTICEFGRSYSGPLKPKLGQAKNLDKHFVWVFVFLRRTKGNVWLVWRYLANECLSNLQAIAQPVNMIISQLVQFRVLINVKIRVQIRPKSMKQFISREFTPCIWLKFQSISTHFEQVLAIQDFSLPSFLC